MISQLKQAASSLNSLCRLWRQPDRLLWMLLSVTVAVTIVFISSAPSAQTLNEQILTMETGLEQEFETYFDADLATVTQSAPEIAQTLSRLDLETGTKSAVMWVIPKGNHLRLVLTTPKHEAVVRTRYDVPDTVLQTTVNRFFQEVLRPSRRSDYPAAQQLYEWIVTPFEADFLEPEGVDTILFCLGNGLRGLPLSALYDGNSFLIEKYSLTRIPAFNLIQTDYKAFTDSQFLAMGASEFENLSPLPAVPIEIDSISQILQAPENGSDWQGKTFLNSQFTLAALQTAVSNQSPDLVHLATHAAFAPGTPKNSYVQLWDQKLLLDDMDTVNWASPALELLVLSACQTAIGDSQAELGFAGVALKAGVKSAVASLWQVSDLGTLVLMSEFYQQLEVAATKAEALRQAQLSMLRGEVGYRDNTLLLSRGSLAITSELSTPAISSNAAETFASPYYWAGFTMISSPW
ncbi:MAG: CHAT domain-containing protein [Leptolyngbyaceae cyanobacterium]